MSPTLFREDGYKFFLRSRGEDRMHVHVCCADGEVRYWSEPNVELARDYMLYVGHCYLD